MSTKVTTRSGGTGDGQRDKEEDVAVAEARKGGRGGKGRTDDANPSNRDATSSTGGGSESSSGWARGGVGGRGGRGRGRGRGGGRGGHRGGGRGGGGRGVHGGRGRRHNHKKDSHGPREDGGDDDGDHDALNGQDDKKGDDGGGDGSGGGREERERQQRPPRLLDANVSPEVYSEDPRTNSTSVHEERRLTAKATSRGNGRNTESFDPRSTLVRPDLRIHVGSSTATKFGQRLRHDDAVIVPDLFGPTDDWGLYYSLLEEMKELHTNGGGGDKENKGTAESEESGRGSPRNDGGRGGRGRGGGGGRGRGRGRGRGKGGYKNNNNARHNKKNNEKLWTSWHEGAHLINADPSGSPTFQKIVHRLCEYFDIDPKSVGTRLNWYKDSLDWKPFHHDSAAFNPHRARTQNITVGASFGATRELAFIHATKRREQEGARAEAETGLVGDGGERSDEDTDEDADQGGGGGNVAANDDVAGRDDDGKCRIYFPQTNNGAFSFGRDANIRWKHGINALHPKEQDGKGRVSIVVWGLARNIEEEDGSPPLLGADGRGPHAAGARGGRFGPGRRHRQGQGGRGGADGGRRGGRPKGQQQRQHRRRSDGLVREDEVGGGVEAENGREKNGTGNGDDRSPKNSRNASDGGSSKSKDQQRPRPNGCIFVPHAQSTFS